MTPNPEFKMLPGRFTEDDYYDLVREFLAETTIPVVQKQKIDKPLRHMTKSMLNSSLIDQDWPRTK